MATFRLRHFSSPSVLRAIASHRLLAFLGQFRDFFSSQGYALPAEDSGQEPDYQRLVDIFMMDLESTPRELLDALFLVDEMATAEGMEKLLEKLEDTATELEDGDEHSPADVAVQIWLLNRDLLERTHAEQFLIRPKTFEYYKSDRDKVPKSVALSAAQCSTMATEMDDWFENKKRGRGSRVFAYPKGDEIWCLVRHGQPFKREESLLDSQVESVCYRPLKYDVVVYNRLLDELRINAQLVGEKKLYREQFGHHLFGDKQYFSINKKYTLDPLREHGEASMSCGDIDGIESVTLREVHLLWGGAFREVEVRKATDIFAALDARGKDIHSHPTILKAVMSVKFTDCKNPRSVTIKPPNVAQYARDSDSVVLEAWMELRGFILHNEVGANAAVEESLADA